MSDEIKKEEDKVEAETPSESEVSKDTDSGADVPAQKTEESAKESPEEADSSKEEVVVPDNFKKLVEEVENMSVLELSELVKVLEKKFGVSASAVAVAAPGAGANGDQEEKSTVTVELSEMGESKIAVIKAVKEILALGLKEAKDIVDGIPSVLKEEIKKEEAEEIKGKIEAAGGKVVFK